MNTITNFFFSDKLQTIALLLVGLVFTVLGVLQSTTAVGYVTALAPMVILGAMVACHRAQKKLEKRK